MGALGIRRGEGTRRRRGRALQEALSQEGAWGHSHGGAGTSLHRLLTSVSQALCQALHIHCLLLGASQGTL